MPERGLSLFGGMKWVTVALATVGDATRHSRVGKLRSKAPLFPSPDFPWDFLLLARQSLEDLGFWVGTGAPGLGFWGDEYSSAQASLCFCLLSREGLGFRFTLTPGGAVSRYPLSHLFLLHLPHSCSYPAHLA